MKFKAEVDVMPLDALLDPQGKAVTSAMGNLGLGQISNVRIGKHMTLWMEADNKEAATKMVDEACQKLLCNAIMEQYRFVVEEIA
ncbi:MAG: phosphoribosylformylglycinamidine synthase subunit PurS [Bacteroidota bacterium]|jgi:phosphoribosylformylglycinamidine synthase